MSTTPTPTPTPATPAPAPAPPAKVPAALKSAFYSAPPSITITQVQTVPLVFDVKATVGNTTVVHRHSIGADGTGPALDVNSLRTALAQVAQQAADKAAWAQAASEINVSDLAEQTT